VGNGFPGTHKRTIYKNGLRLLLVFEESINYGGWGINYPIRDQGQRDARLETVQSESLNTQGECCRLIENQHHVSHLSSVTCPFTIKECPLQLNIATRGFDPRVSYK
jgi:hypothetical protein